MTIPSADVIAAIESGAITTLRRAEFYESDGITQWFPAGADEPDSRLESGSVSVDYNRSERRSVDLSFDNEDNALRPNSDGGLWYDKIIKVYRGVRYRAPHIPPKAAIVYENTAGDADAFRQLLQQIGFSNIDVLLDVTTAAELAGYEIVIVHANAGAPDKIALMTELYDLGKKVITTGLLSTQLNHPMISTVGALINTTYGVTPMTTDTPVNSGWTSELAAVTPGRAVVTFPANVTAIATYLHSGTPHYTGLIKENVVGGKWAHFQLPSFTTQGKILLQNVYNWLWGYEEFVDWETQIGEFLIDNIQEPHFPHLTKITGRDYTKRCLLSRMETAVSFSAGTPLETLVTALAANAGIVKFSLPVTGVTLSDRLDFDRTTERWKVIEQACNSNGYEVYFTADGYLTMRPYLDPVLSPISQTFLTGSEGNLASFERSLNDSRLYNHVIVTGETAAEGALPFFGEARNDEPSSPTRIGRIGDRSYFYTSSFFTSDQQCIDTAQNFLKIHALESYELNFSSIVYPWLEPGEIVEFLDPRALGTDPTRFLLDTLTIPLSLGPMSATGKRVTFVGDSSLVS